MLEVKVVGSSYTYIKPEVTIEGRISESVCNDTIEALEEAIRIIRAYRDDFYMDYADDAP